MQHKIEPWHNSSELDPDDKERLAYAERMVEPEERVEFILGEMMACTWAPGDQRRFARVWDIEPTKVQRLVSRAARIYREHMDPEEMRAKMTAGLDYLMERAMNAHVYDFKQGVSVHQPDLKNAIESYRLQAHLNGMLTDKHEISGPGGGPLAAVTADIRRLSPEELDELIVKKAKEIESKKLTEGEKKDEDE